MKSPRSRISLAGCGCLLALALPAKASESAAQPARPDDPVQIETALIAKVHAAALQDGEADFTSLLASESPFREPIAPSVLLARRTMAVCGWLQGDNQYGRAMKIAQRSLVLLAGMKESSEADHAERLYWEALLEGRVLDHKVRAIELLQAAQKLNPDDDRTLELEHEFAVAVAEFGR